MSNISVDYDILNQKQTPAFYASSLATRPAFGFPGRIFIDTDTPSSGIYRDTGSAWVQVADPGAGTTGTLQQVTTNGNTTTLPILVQSISIGKGNLSVATNTTLGVASLINNTTGASNTAIGNQTLPVNTTGTGNTAIGSFSLAANTTGGYNTGIGQQSLYNNTTASFNTAIGNSSLSANVSGEYNTAIGESSLSTQGTANNNTAIGSAALTANTTGTPNTAIGRLSLATNTTGGSNTAIGSQSLYLNTTGSSNTAIGVGALQNNTTASTNTAIGSSALQNNSTGTQNTAIGSSALGLNTTAGDNTSIGFAAMQFNTIGTGNTAIGSSSLRANTTFNFNTALGGGALTNALASNNTAIGYGTLQSTTGANNTAIGLNSLQNNTTGIDNTAVGLSSLGVNTTGQYNVAFGRSSLNANTIGNFNTAIGSQALANITTGSQNIAIGYNSGGGITTGSSNTIIGTSVTGLPAGLSQNIILADGVGNVRLFSDANGLIGINQAVGSVPGGQLDIHTAQTYALVLNGLTTNNAYTAFSNNSVGKWRIGNTYNAGANTFDIYNLGTSSNALSINSTSNVVTLNSYPLIDGGSVLIKLGSNTSAPGYTGIGAVATGLTINLGAAGTTGSLLFNTSGSYLYTFPAATGTLALTSNLGSYLPLAGGTLTGDLIGTTATFNIDSGTQPTYTSGTAGKFIRSASGIYAGVRIALVGGSAGGDNGIDFYNTSTLVGQFGYGAGGQEFYTTKSLTINSNFAGNGTFGSFGQLHIAGASDPNKKLTIGYNTSNNNGFIQPMQNGTSYSPLLLNSSGGNVLIGSTTDDTINKLQVNGNVKANGFNAVNGLTATYSLGTIAQFTTITQSIPTSGLYILTNGGNLSGLILITIAGGSRGVQLIFTTGINNVAAGTTTNPGTGGYLNVWIGSSGVLSIENVNGYTGPYYLTSIATF
jgi:hypothetical protein